MDAISPSAMKHRRRRSGEEVRSIAKQLRYSNTAVYCEELLTDTTPERDAFNEALSALRAPARHPGRRDGMNATIGSVSHRATSAIP